MSVHMEHHVKGILCRGSRRRLALKVIQSKKEALQPGEPGLAPAAGAASSSDPLEQFHSERPAYEERRYRNRTDTSDEEGLEKIEYCGTCGSDDCWREPSLCKQQHKKTLQDLLLVGFLEEVPVQTKDVKVEGHISASALHEATEVLETWQNRSEVRENSKANVYARRRERQRGKSKADARGSVEVLLTPGTTLGYENISKLIRTSALNLGGTHLNIRRDLGEMVNRGQDYFEGTAADSVIWSAIQLFEQSDSRLEISYA